MKEKRTLLIVDPDVVSHSPTMQGLVKIFDTYAELFDEIEIWAQTCKEEIANHPKVKWVKFRSFPLGPLQLLAYQFRVQLRYDFLKAIGKDNWTLKMVSGFFLKKADIRYIQFSNVYFGRIIAEHPQHLHLPRWKIAFNKLSARREKKYLKKPGHTKNLWVVSRRLGEELHHDSGKQGNLVITPNKYDVTRFNHQTREANRAAMRAHYGIAEDELLLAFVCMGHFERKGLPEAMQGVTLAKESGIKVKLIVFGGSEKRIEKFHHLLKAQGITAENVHFAGPVKEVEKHLSAADGFIFPSYFEAFSLAEIEAAALGLRLYLTPHYGSEMILRDPTNGRWITWEPENIAQILQEEYQAGVIGQTHNETAEALNAEEYKALIKASFIQALAEAEK